MTIATALDLAALFIFALTGGLAASRAGLDLIGFLFLGCLTGIGGGTLRDLLLGRDQVFWVASPHLLGVACAAAAIAFLTAHRLQQARSLVWLDALALAVATAAGTAIARDAGAVWPIIMVMGVVTATFGGLMRDVVANDIPMVLRQGELYVSASLGGAVAGIALLTVWPGANSAAALTTAGVTFALRAGSIVWGWRLPVYRPPN